MHAWFRFERGSHSLAARYGWSNPRCDRRRWADASSRRYFRVDGDGGVDRDGRTTGYRGFAPFVRVAGLMRTAAFSAHILVQRSSAGLLLLSDLGDTTYLTSLTDANADEFFGDAIDALIRWQLSPRRAFCLVRQNCCNGS